VIERSPELMKWGLAAACLVFLAACSNAVCLGGPEVCSSSSSSSGGSSSSSSSGGTPPGTGIEGFVTPSTISAGSTATVGVNITNSAATAEAGIDTSVEFSSSISINAGPTYNCSPGTVTTSKPNAGTVEITLTNASVPAATTCVLSATITPPGAGQYTISAGGQNLTLTVQ
jgi:hypothetical protein